MKFRSPLVPLAVAVATVFGVAAPAHADAGTYTAQSYQVVFFYDVSSGNAYSNQNAGRGSERLSIDAPGVNLPQTVVGELYRKDFWSQTRLVQLSANYSAAAKYSAYYNLTSSNTYATRAVWNYSGAQAGMPSGYSRRG